MAARLEERVSKAHMAVCFCKLAPCQSLCPWADALPCILPLLLKQNKNNQVSSHSRQAALSPGCIFSAFFPGRAQFSVGHSSGRLRAHPLTLSKTGCDRSFLLHVLQSVPMEVKHERETYRSATEGSRQGWLMWAAGNSVVWHLQPNASDASCYLTLSKAWKQV